MLVGEPMKTKRPLPESTSNLPLWLRRTLRTIIIVGAGALLGTLISWKAQRSLEIQNEVSKAERKSVAVEDISTARFKEITRADRKDALKLAGADAASISAECLNWYAPLLKVKMTEEPTAKSFPVMEGSSCSGETEHLAKWRMAYQMACDPAALAEGTDVQKTQSLAACMVQFVFFRANIISEIHQKDKVADIEDLALLVDLLISSATRSEIPRLEEVALRMREVAPDMYEPVKALIVARIAKLSAAPSEADQAELMSLLERDIEVAKGIARKDPELVEAMLMVRSRMMADLDRMEPFLTELEHQDPQSATLSYYRARLLWKEGKKSEALARLRELSKRYPEEARFKETLNGLLKDPNGDGKGQFTSTLKVTFDFSDLSSPSEN